MEVIMLPTRSRNGVTFSPWTGFVGLRREMDEMLNVVNAMQESGNRVWTPPVSVREDAETVTLEMELPGIDPAAVDISIEGQLLTISGEKRDERSEERENVHLLERRYGRFERSFTVPRGIDAERIEARFERGVLHLTLPRPEESKPRRIRINPEGMRQVENREDGR
jgi:HSP20 family protein